jgi:hypothetical protein
MCSAAVARLHHFPHRLVAAHEERFAQLSEELHEAERLAAELQRKYENRCDTEIALSPLSPCNDFFDQESNLAIELLAF